MGFSDVFPCSPDVFLGFSTQAGLRSGLTLTAVVDPIRLASTRRAMAAAWCFGATRGTSSGSSSNFGCWTFLDEDWDSTGGSTLIKKE